MKAKPDGTPERRRSDRVYLYLSVFIVAPMTAVLAFIPLTGFCILSAAMAQLFGGLGTLIGSCLLFLMGSQVFTHLFFAIVSSDWMGLIAQLPSLLAWLQAVGLL